MVAGYAVATARPIVRVDVSADKGRHWRQAELQGHASSPWSWMLWRAELSLPAGEHVLAVRAWDAAVLLKPAPTPFSGRARCSRPARKGRSPPWSCFWN